FHNKRTRGRAHFDLADLMAVDLWKGNLQLCRNKRLSQSLTQHVPEMHLKSVSIATLKSHIVVLQPKNGSIIADANKQGSSLTVPEGSDLFLDHVFELRVEPPRRHVPAQTRLELQLVGLTFGYLLRQRCGDSRRARLFQR